MEKTKCSLIKDGDPWNTYEFPIASPFLIILTKLLYLINVFITPKKYILHK